MGLVLTDDRHYKAIADKIRECLPEEYAEATYTPAEMPSGIDDVANTQFNTGYDNGVWDGESFGWQMGYDDGQMVGYEEGKQAEYDRFWDAYQQNGTRTLYDCAFSQWPFSAFNPKHDIKPTSAYMMFRTLDSFVTGQSTDADLVKRLEECGVVLDTSDCTNFQYMFMNSFVTHIGVIDTRSASQLYQPFSANRYHTFDKLILRDDGSQTFGNHPFSGASALVNIEIEGVIGQNGLSFQWSTKLSNESITSVVNALSTTTSGLSITLSKVAVDKAFEIAQGDNNGSTESDWAALVATRPNWTINLV